jgi:hypothetical protein
LFQEVFTQNGKTDFRGLFLVPCFVATVAAIALAIFFHPPKSGNEDVSISAPSH